MSPQEHEDPLAFLQVSPFPINLRVALKLSDDHLQNEFSTLDSSLVAAILNDTGDIDAARETLSILQLETIIDDIGPDEGNQSYPECGDSVSDETYPTTLSLSSWRISEEEDEYEESGMPDKVGHLARIFPKQTRFTLKSTLDKCQGDVEKAVDELLNLVFLNEDQEKARIKSIDGFDTDFNLNGGRKRRRGRKGKANGNENHPPDHQRSISLPNGDTNPANHWESMSYEIKHLATSLNLPEKTVASVYHSCGRAIAPTIVALLDNNNPSTLSLEPSHLEQLHELSAEFGHDVEFHHLETLLKLCQENKVAVFELAEILAQHSTKPTIKFNTTSLSGAPFLPQTRSHHADIKNGWTTVGASYASSSSSSSSMPSPPNSPRSSHRPLNPRSATNMLTTHTVARNEAFAKAAASYRKSKSSPHMGGVASYYADIGHHHNSQVHSIRNDVAERLVEANSKPDMLDLHGVTVQQAVKFARERTTDWWVRQRRERELAGGAGGAGWGRKAVEPFHIVTGLGRHSKGGVPQLMPAVSKMLIRENWKIQVEQGHIVVYGVKGK